MDVLVLPTMREPAPLISETVNETHQRPPSNTSAFNHFGTPAMTVPFTMLANLCWNPAASVPAGLTAAGLPVGLQIIGRRHADEVVLRLARLFEQARPWPRHAPARNAYDAIVTLPRRAPGLAYRYLFDRQSFYKPTPAP